MTEIHAEGDIRLKKTNYLLAVILCIGCCLLSGCLESSFQLANESRLPAWIKLPPGLKRQDVSLTLNYYSNPFGANAKFILKNRRGDVLEEISGTDKPINGVSEYPGFVLVTVNGVSEIIEHPTKGPIFYVCDDASKIPHEQ
jgi:hypothetical protein